MEEENVFLAKIFPNNIQGQRASHIFIPLINWIIYDTETRRSLIIFARFQQVFASYLQFCGVGLRNAQLYEKSQLEVKRNQVLLDLARMIFEEQSTIEHMVFRILTHMQSLIQCQRVQVSGSAQRQMAFLCWWCSRLLSQILLVHEASKGSFSRVFDFEANDDLNEDGEAPRTSPFESRFPINIGITGHVAATGEVGWVFTHFAQHFLAHYLQTHRSFTDCNNTKCLRGPSFRSQCWWELVVQAQIHFMYGHQELIGTDNRRDSVDQQVWWLGKLHGDYRLCWPRFVITCCLRIELHQKRWKLCRGFRHFLRHGHPQYPHVREGNCGDGEAKRHARGSQLSCIGFDWWCRKANGEFYCRFYDDDWRHIYPWRMLSLTGSQNTVISVLSTSRFPFWWLEFGRWWHT